MIQKYYLVVESVLAIKTNTDQHCIRNQYLAPLQLTEEKAPATSKLTIYFEMQGCPNRKQKRKHLRGSGETAKKSKH